MSKESDKIKRVQRRKKLFAIDTVYKAHLFLHSNNLFIIN